MSKIGPMTHLVGYDSTLRQYVAGDGLSSSRRRGTRGVFETIQTFKLPRSRTSPSGCGPLTEVCAAASHNLAASASLGETLGNRY